MDTRKFTAQFKTKVVLEALKERESDKELAERFGITPHQKCTWTREFLENADKVFGSETESMQDESGDQKSNQIALVDKYCKVWNEVDVEKKRIELEKIWFSEGEYIDPRVKLKGIDELVNHIHKIQLGRPGSKILRTSEIEIHHQIGRFRWQLEMEDTTRLPEGLDIVYFTSDGRQIKRIVGFFGDLKPIEEEEEIG